MKIKMDIHSKLVNLQAMKRFLIISLFIFAISTIKAQDNVLKIYIIGDAKIACIENNTILSCLKVKHHPDSNWKSFPYPIEGFEFVPGKEAKIVVEETKIAFPEDNGPKYTYKLSSVIEVKSTVLDNKLLLGNNTFKLINLEKDMKFTPARKAGAYFNFNIDSNTMSGFLGCNRFSSNSNYEDGVIQFGLIKSTKMACINNDIEGMLSEGMKGKAAFYVRNNMLFVVCENHLIMHLRPQKRLDSIIQEIQKPKAEMKGNRFARVNPEQVAVILEDLESGKVETLLFKDEALSEKEAENMQFKLINYNPNAQISEIQVLMESVPGINTYKAILILKDGSKKNIEITDAS
ncbi:MAG: DUF4377 domain-containing protein [Bacteroidia bacterium]